MPPKAMLRRVLAALLAGLMWLAVPSGAAEEDEPDTSSLAPQPGVADLESLRIAAEDDTSLSEDDRSRILDVLARAVDERQAVQGAAKEKAYLESRIRAAPARIAELTAQAEQPASTVDDKEWAELDLTALAQRSRETQAALADARDELTRRETDLAQLTGLGASLSDQIATGTQALRELERSASAPPDGELPAVATAREAFLAARRARLVAEVETARLKSSNYEQLVRLATFERDAAALLVPRLDAQREALVAAVDGRRAENARVGREEAVLAQAATEMLPTAVARLATANAGLREELETVTLASGEIAERLRTAERRVSELDADLASIQQRVETIGPSEAIGRLLRRRLNSLTDIDADVRQERGRGNEIVRGTDRRIDLAEQRRDLADLPAVIDLIMQSMESLPEAASAGFDDAWLREQALALLTAKRATIDELLAAYGRYLTKLTSHDAAERQLAVTADTMRGFIRQELLWIRSLPPFSPSDLVATPRALAPLLDPANWRRLATDAAAAVAADPARVTFGWLASLALLLLRPWARRRLAAYGQLTASIRTDAFSHTFAALLLTVLIAVAWPLIIAQAAWSITGTVDVSGFSREISRTLLFLAELGLMLGSVRWVLRTDGLGHRHFRWSQSVRAAFEHELRWLAPVLVLCIVYAVAGTLDGTVESRLALSRPALVAFSLALMIADWRLTRRHGELGASVDRQRAGAITVRTWMFWSALFLMVPAANIVATMAGYEYTSTVVLRLMVETGFLVFGILVLYEVMLRWFTVAERRLRFERALKQREEARAERERQQREGDEPAAQDVLADVEVPEVDFRALGEQARTTLQALIVASIVLSLWAIWSDLLPALSVLDRVHLPFSRATLVDGIEQRAPVTLRDALFAVFLVVATLFAARNLPGLLGFTLLRRVVGDAGKQYAIVTLCQYALVGGGVLFAFSHIGMEWSKLQWLVAALSVGLGFGLQEIVANFVSGIILLLERPVRVGDVVTVGDATGTVARIQIRATTLIDFDRKELVLPNKELITGRLLNWTLSNDVLRLIVRVGVAYGSDVRRARELLLEAATENEHVMDEPRPIILFNAFGDNALGLELRVYLPSLDHWLTVETALHDAIYDKFNAAGIVIAFPQRDIHLDTSAPLDIRLHGGDEPAPRWRGRGAGKRRS